MVKPGLYAYKKIRKAFGNEFFDDANGGELLRQKLGQVVFEDVEVYILEKWRTKIYSFGKIFLINF